LGVSASPRAARRAGVLVCVYVCKDSAAPAHVQHTRVHAHTGPRRHARVPACMYVCKDLAAPAHARTRAHRPAAPHQSSGVSQTPYPTACLRRVTNTTHPTSHGLRAGGLLRQFLSESERERESGGQGQHLGVRVGFMFISHWHNKLCARNYDEPASQPQTATER